MACKVPFINFGKSTYEHYWGELAKYKAYIFRLLLIVGGNSLVEQHDFDGNQKTEILKIDVQNFTRFTRGKTISGHYLVTIESSYINGEYVLVIGGR